MSEVVEFHPINEVHARIIAAPGIKAEIKEAFTFDAPGARFSKQFKRGFWDGRISLFKNDRLYVGLKSALKDFCQKRGYEFEAPSDDVLVPCGDEIDQFILSLDIPEKYAARDYQMDTLRRALEGHRALFLSPTSSGKSLMIYHLIRWYETKTLIIVPTVTLVHQLAGDFIDYGFHPDNIHTIVAGSERITDKPVVISTWQSVVKMLDNPEWFQQFGMVIGDEAHRFSAKSLIAIMESFKECSIRYGFTGSLDDSKCNALTLEGLFGPIHQVTTTRELMDAGYVSNLDIKVIFLKHPDHVRKNKFKYQDEIDYLIASPARNQFLCELALTLEGNTLLLYHRVGDHGIPLADMLRKQTARPVHLIHGKIDGDTRNEVRAVIEEQDNAIIIASVGTYSTGVNIKRLNNIIMAASFRSRVMNLQSIGRGLRLADDKVKCNLFDVVDDLSWKKRRNFVLQHGEVRIRLYNEQQFQYQMHKVNL